MIFLKRAVSAVYSAPYLPGLSSMMLIWAIWSLRLLCYNCELSALLSVIDMCNYRELLLGLSTNVNHPSVYLDLSNNDMRSEGGMVLGSCVANLQNVKGLDLSDNG